MSKVNCQERRPSPQKQFIAENKLLIAGKKQLRGVGVAEMHWDFDGKKCAVVLFLKK